eukprot:2029175-Rhodomonas_salina.1
MAKIRTPGATSTQARSAAGDAQQPSPDTAEKKEEKDVKHGDTLQTEGAKLGKKTQIAAQTAAVSVDLQPP